MKLKGSLSILFCLTLVTHGRTTTYASGLEQPQGVDVSVETTNNGIIIFTDGDDEIGVFFPEEILKKLPVAYQSKIGERGWSVIQPVNDSINAVTTKTYQAQWLNVNDSIYFAVTWNYNSSSTFGLQLPAPYNPVVISTTTKGEFAGSYVSKINGGISPYIKNNSATRTTKYGGTIKFTMN